VLEQLAKLSLPAAVILGQQYIATTPEYAQRMASIIPNAKLYEISDAGHSAAVEKPIEVADAMQDFHTSTGICSKIIDDHSFKTPRQSNKRLTLKTSLFK